MKYYFELSLKYMRKHVSRTIYTILGIMLTSILVFSVFTTGYSLWELALELNYSGDTGRTQLLAVDCSKEYVEKVNQYVSVSNIVIWDEDAHVVSLSALDENHKYRVYIGLKDTSNLRKSARELEKNLGNKVTVDSEIEMYLNQGDSIQRNLYNSVVVIFGTIFALFSVMILRNIMIIAVVERMKDYGLMRCVGMSGKQLYTLLMAEGMVIGIGGAVAGIVFGYFILQGVAAWINPILAMPVPLHFGVYPKAVVYTVVLCILAVLYALIEPARQAELLSPIEAIHNNITLKGRKGGLAEKITYHSGKLWGRFFGVSGEYAYKNMMRNRGRFIYLFIGMFVCTVLFGCIYSFMESIFATVKYNYEGMNTEFAEYIYVGTQYNEKTRDEICQDLLEVDGVQGVGMVLQKQEFRVYDQKLEEVLEAINSGRFGAYGYDEEHFEQLKPYLVDGEISYEKMEKENGVILCDSIHRVRDETGDFATKRMSDYQVGDTISTISTEGRDKAYQLFIDAVNEAAENTDIHTTTTQDYEGETRTVQPAEYSSGIPGFEKLFKETRRLLQEKGYDIGDTYMKDVEYDSMYMIPWKLEEILYNQGEKEVYTIQGIVSEDIYSGGIAAKEYSVISLLRPASLILKDPSHIGPPVAAGQEQEVVSVDENYYRWGIGFTRDINSINQTVSRYCKNKNKHEGLELKYSNGNWQYMDTLRTIQIAKIVASLVGGCIVLISLLQIFNTVCSSMSLRRRELWLYEVVGMSRRQERWMVILENSVAALLAAVIGYLVSWGLSWYFVEFLLNQDQSIKYVYPAGKNLLLAMALFVLAVLASLLGKRFAIKSEN